MAYKEKTMKNNNHVKELRGKKTNWKGKKRLRPPKKKKRNESSANNFLWPLVEEKYKKKGTETNFCPLNNGNNDPVLFLQAFSYLYIRSSIISW